MDNIAATPKKRGLRAVLISLAVIALGSIIALCAVSCANPDGVVGTARNSADRISPVLYQFSYNSDEMEAGEPVRKTVVVSSEHFIRRGGELQSIDTYYYDIDWDDETRDFSLEPLAPEQQEPSALNGNRFWFRFFLILPWALGALLLVTAFGVIGTVVHRELRTLDEVAEALENERKHHKNRSKK